MAKQVEGVRAEALELSRRIVEARRRAARDEWRWYLTSSADEKRAIGAGARDEEAEIERMEEELQGRIDELRLMGDRPGALEIEADHVDEILAHRAEVRAEMTGEVGTN